MIIAMTGGTGFIGKKLVLKHLENGDEVRIFSRRDPRDIDLPASIKWFQGNLERPKNMDSFLNQVDVLYHCAGEIRDESRMETVHLHGTNLLIQAATGKIGRWVQLSSVGAYGLKQDGEVNENSTLNPLGMYEVTKAKSDALVRAAAGMGSFDYAILRPSIVYGAGMSNRSLFSLIAAVKKGIFVFIGKPGASANYVHVDNVVEALFLCGNKQEARGQIYNISDYRTLEDFIDIIARLFNKKKTVVRLPELPMRLLIKCIGWIPKMPLTTSRMDALTNKAFYPIDKIKNDLSYEHVMSMEDGLAEMVDALKNK